MGVYLRPIPVAGALNTELMGIYKVKVSTPEGRVFHREIAAESEAHVSAVLAHEGLYPLKITSSEGFTGRLASLFVRKGAVNTPDFLVFNQGLATLLKAGLPLTDCLETLAGISSDPVLNGAIKEAVREVRSGKTLSEAMSTQAIVFPLLYTAAISAGESTGDLVPTIRSYTEYQQKVEAIRKKIISSATYPAVLAGISLLVIIFLVTYVVPSFASIYLGTGAQLPLPTMVLIGITEFIKEFFYIIILFSTGGALGLLYYLKSGKGRLFVDRMKLVLPYLRDIYTDYAMSRFSRTLGMVLKSGVPLIKGLEMTRVVLRNSVLEAKLRTVIRKAREGRPVTQAIEEEGFMPAITLKMFGVGERSASLQSILGDIADYHDSGLDYKVGIMTDLIEPALMVFMGIIIGTIVVLMYLPIFQLGARI